MFVDPLEKYYCWQSDVFSTEQTSSAAPWLVFWLPERPISLAARRNTNNSPAQDVSGMTERGGCDIDHAIIGMSAHKWHHWHHNLRLPILYSLETKTRSKLNLCLCTFDTKLCSLYLHWAESGIKMKCNLNSQSAYTSCQVLSLWLLLTMNRDLKHQQQLEA